MSQHLPLIFFWDENVFLNYIALYRTWTNACSCCGLAVRKRNWRFCAGETAKS